MAPLDGARLEPSAVGTERALVGGRTTALAEEPPAPPAPPMEVTFEPAPNALDVRPDTPVGISLRNGRLTSMSVISPSGPVPGAFSGGRFTPAAPLGFGQTYTVSGTAVSAAGDTEALRSTFTTLVPAAEISADIMPWEGEVMGVGMPVIVTFTSAVPATDRAALAARFAVSSAPAAVEGAWRWLDETTMHWRPRTYWPAGSLVSVTANVAGHAVGEEWFTAPLSRSFTIGADHRITIDATTHQMVAYENGQPVRIMPISTGKDAYPTASGIDLIMEKHSVFEMDSSSVGIGGSEAYLVTVADAQRLTNSGTFIHAAPWNGQLGEANLSHGCVNASNEDAAWMMEFTLDRRPGRDHRHARAGELGQRLGRLERPLRPVGGHRPRLTPTPEAGCRPRPGPLPG